jgi:succinate dehydrogenase/fumarate reductase flavoprotein subunit
VPGLYAIGESAGGCHGSNRLANNAFTECYVFGKRAGEHAAAHVQSRAHGRIAPDTLIQAHVSRIEQRTRHASGKRNFQEVRHSLRQCLWDQVGVIRTGDVLGRGLETIRSLAEAAGACLGDRPATMVRCLELDNLLLTSEAIALSALYREESRGTHYRGDFPERNDADWLCNVLVHQRADGTLEPRKSVVVTV